MSTGQQVKQVRRSQFILIHLFDEGRLRAPSLYIVMGIMLWSKVEDWKVMYNQLMELRDPKLDGFPLMDSPFPMLAIILVYLLFVHLGSKWMKHRQPYRLNHLMFAYNCLMVLISFYIFSWFGYAIVKRGYSMYCTNWIVYDLPDGHCLKPWVSSENLYHLLNAMCLALIPQTQCNKTTLVAALDVNGFLNISTDMLLQAYYAGWLSFYSKVIELLDTVFFILRKKFKQVTFLHVYHHTMTTFCFWFGARFLPNGPVIIFPFLNCFVHVIMYTYYALTSVGYSLRTWKKYLTKIQLVQFLAFLVPSVLYQLYDCPFAKMYFSLVLFYVITLVVLFTNFYIKAYLSTDRHPRQTHLKSEKQKCT
ncbi:elongation of very long chain fatty acids protein 4-like [Biomphalaria glabrata]|uniref:Elongation of very long chain fatty acids protein n=1 Tax=Biomphalaria glabrata TaxID=6526 RepID=A0A9W3AC10_BIOGL|nr:elongation of very long chain fatty acids protein 4-like [Biomphalaria glabrata]